ncbi:hypothetical protein ACW73L_11750 [Methylolobus aquaticus]
MKAKVEIGKRALAVMGIALAGAYAGSASAHSQTGSLGAAASARDVYKVTCAAGSAHLYFRIQDVAPVAAPPIRITVRKGGTTLRSVDTVDNDGRPSPARRLRQGAGVYTMIINKANTAGAENYFAEFHCENAANVHTGTGWYTTINQ